MLTLHVGLHKTGTTSIQAALRAANGIGYEFHDLHRHTMLGSIGYTIDKHRIWKSSTRRPPLPPFTRGHHVVSYEDLAWAEPDGAAAFLRQQFGPVQPIITTRSLRRLLVSWWAQSVVMGESLPWHSWVFLRDWWSDHPAPEMRAVRCDHANRVWGEATGKPPIIVDTGTGDAVEHFFAAARIDAPLPTPPERSKVTRSLATIEAIRRWNEHNPLATYEQVHHAVHTAYRLPSPKADRFIDPSLDEHLYECHNTIMEAVTSRTIATLPAPDQPAPLYDPTTADDTYAALCAALEA